MKLYNQNRAKQAIFISVGEGEKLPNFNIFNESHISTFSQNRFNTTPKLETLLVIAPSNLQIVGGGGELSYYLRAFT